MFFSNLQPYRLGTVSWTAPQLSQFLERLQHRQPGNQERSSRGFVPPVEHGDLVHSVNGQWMICLRTDERILPASVINEEAAKRAKALEEQQGFRPGRKQLRELKELVEQEMLPAALFRSRRTFVWIDPANGWLMVDSSSQTKAEEVLESLRKCVDDLPVRHLSVKRSPISVMTDWLATGEAPSGFTIDRECLLVSVGEEKAKAAYTNHVLTSDGPYHQQIKQHLEGGKLPKKLAVTWDNRISFVLTDTLELKKVHFLDILKEEAEKSAENASEIFDCEFMLMTGELQRMLCDVVEVLGGEMLVQEGGA